MADNNNDDIFMDTLPQSTKFHQRVTHSLSIRPSTSSQLHRSQSLALEDKTRRFNIRWRQQRTSDDITITKPTNIFDKELPRVPSSHRLSPMDRLASSSSSSPPTLREFYTWISDYLTPLTKANHIISITKLGLAKDCLFHLLDNVDDETFESKFTLRDQLQAIKIPTPPSSFPVLAEILKSLLRILAALKSTTYYPFKLIDSTGIAYTLEPPCMTTINSEQVLWPDHLTSNTHWFHTYFCGRDYTTLIIPIKSTITSTTTLYAIVTGIQEPMDNYDNESIQYRLIIRLPKETTKRYLVSDTQVNDYLAKKEGRSNDDLQKPIKQQRRSLRGHVNFTSNDSQYKMMKAAILSVQPDLDMTKAICLSATTTSACNLEKDLLRLDGIEVPPAYKFGVLSILNNQTKEEDWFSNTGLSSSFDQFLNILGNRIQLKGYKGYAAGLDTKTGETGDTSVISKWMNYEIMFHVAALMPFRENDKQQVQRKRYIGNDIVCVVFLEGDAIFDPKAIRSKFLHVYIVVRQEIANQKRRWRMEVVRKSNVPYFGPILPNPPLFYDEQTLQNFLTVKLINAENAALKCDNFSIPNNRARAGILEGMVEKGLAQEDESFKKSTMKRQPSQRTPPSSSSSGNRLSRGSLRSIRSNPDNTMNNKVEAPPLPSPTRSTMLQDLKNFALRRAPTFTQRSSTTKEQSIPEEDGNGDDEQPPYTNSLPSAAPNTSVHQPTKSNDDSLLQRSILAAKSKSQLFKSTTNSPPSPRPIGTSSVQPDGLRYKTQNLMINVVAKRSSTRPMTPTLADGSS
ncbi:uncharacterized protein BX664DRAFT_342650 [Halteromyces radiatus]|uniref:uncharacterized protein n=1 Tax=Halteromyces radiatus TaxID=101107 RepID=UPI00221E53F8|nr:uncharacterized protein BX664DRAFT_342650 [Halteromyces radiatus]KAI8078768.1 hypothetical protein BX664DRAFT_342650 [Halteromyces radiatus]